MQDLVAFKQWAVRKLKRKQPPSVLQENLAQEACKPAEGKAQGLRPLAHRTESYIGAVKEQPSVPRVLFKESSSQNRQLEGGAASAARAAMPPPPSRQPPPPKKTTT